MYQEHSNMVPVTFQEFVAYFSDNEMKLLQEWQNELYRNVMQEIEHALISLGPHIARSVFSIRAKEKQEVFVMEHKDSETRLNVGHYTNSPSCSFVSIPAIEQDVSLVKVPAIKGEESSAVSFTDSSCSSVSMPAIEQDISLVKVPAIKGEESSVVSFTDSPLCSSVSIPAIEQDVSLVKVPAIKGEETSAVSFTDSPSCSFVNIPVIEQDVSLVKVPAIKREESSAVSFTGEPLVDLGISQSCINEEVASFLEEEELSRRTGEPLVDLGLSQSCINEEVASFLEEEGLNRRRTGPVVTAIFALGGNSKEEMHCKVKEEPDGRISVNKHCSSTPLEYVQSKQGSKQLVWKGYLHRKERETSGKILWRCARYQILKCHCRLHTIGDEVVHYTPHNHLPKPWEVESKKLKAALKKKMPVMGKPKMDTS